MKINNTLTYDLLLLSEFYKNEKSSTKSILSNEYILDIERDEIFLCDRMGNKIKVAEKDKNAYSEKENNFFIYTSKGKLNILIGTDNGIKLIKNIPGESCTFYIHRNHVGLSNKTTNKKIVINTKNGKVKFLNNAKWKIDYSSENFCSLGNSDANSLYYKILDKEMNEIFNIVVEETGKKIEKKTTNESLIIKCPRLPLDYLRGDLLKIHFGDEILFLSPKSRNYLSLPVFKRKITKKDIVKDDFKSEYISLNKEIDWTEYYHKKIFSEKPCKFPIGEIVLDKNKNVCLILIDENANIATEKPIDLTKITSIALKIYNANSVVDINQKDRNKITSFLYNNIDIRENEYGALITVNHVGIFNEKGEMIFELREGDHAFFLDNKNIYIFKSNNFNQIFKDIINFGAVAQNQDAYYSTKADITGTLYLFDAITRDLKKIDDAQRTISINKNTLLEIAKSKGFFNILPIKIYDTDYIEIFKGTGKKGKYLAWYKIAEHLNENHSDIQKYSFKMSKNHFAISARNPDEFVSNTKLLKEIFSYAKSIYRDAKYIMLSVSELCFPKKIYYVYVLDVDKDILHEIKLPQKYIDKFNFEIKNDFLIMKQGLIKTFDVPRDIVIDLLSGRIVLPTKKIDKDIVEAIDYEQLISESILNENLSDKNKKTTYFDRIIE